MRGLISIFLLVTVSADQALYRGSCSACNGDNPKLGGSTCTDISGGWSCINYDGDLASTGSNGVGIRDITNFLTNPIADNTDRATIWVDTGFSWSLTQGGYNTYCVGGCGGTYTITVNKGTCSNCGSGDQLRIRLKYYAFQPLVGEEETPGLCPTVQTTGYLNLNFAGDTAIITQTAREIVAFELSNTGTDGIGLYKIIVELGSTKVYEIKQNGDKSVSAGNIWVDSAMGRWKGVISAQCIYSAPVTNPLWFNTCMKCTPVSF